MSDFPTAGDLQATPGTIGSNGHDQDEARAVLDVVDALRDEFADRDAMLADIERVIFLENAVDIPTGYMKTALEVRSPYPSHIINTITSALSVNPPYVSFDPVGIGDQAQENQVLRQHFFNASWERQQQEARRPLFRQFCHSVVGYGEGILKTTERKKRVWNQYGTYSKKLRAELDADTSLDDDSKDRVYDARTEEYKRGAGYPIASTDVPPSTFYYLKNEDGFTICAEVKEIPYLEAVARFSVGVTKSGSIVPEATGLPLSDTYKALGERSTVEVIEIWDWQKCFPGETVVTLDSPARYISRRWYTGDLIEVTTAGGNKLAGTPNHPILTDRGWVALGDLAEGHRVVRRRLEQEGAAGDPDHQHVEASLGQLFDLAAHPGVNERRPGRKGDFHGDGQDADVDVVTIDGQLWNRIKSTLAKPAAEDDLALANMGVRLLPSSRGGEHPFKGDLTATHRRGQARGDAFLVLGRPAAHFQRLGFAHGAQLNTHAAQALVDRGHRHAEISSQDARRRSLVDVPPDQERRILGAPSVVRAERHASARQGLTDRLVPVTVASRQLTDGQTTFDVLADEIVHVERRQFAGHVYNLETKLNTYSAHGVIAHNCSYLVRGAPQKERKSGDRGLLVKTLKHGYGDKDRKVLRGPYFHSMGITTSSRELYKQSQGVLFAFLRLFPLLDRLLTIRGQAAVTYGFGAFKRARGSGNQLSDSAFGVSADEQSATDEEIRPGYVYPDDIEPINMPSGGPDIDKAIADVRAMIELALPSVAQGVVGGESGYAINQAAHLSRLAWNPIIANIEQTLSERVSFESWLIENRVKEQVWVYGSLPDELGPRRRRARPDEGWLGIDGDDLKGLHRYRVHLKPETPSNQVIEIRMHNDMMKMQVESRQQAIEALGGNPIEVERQLMFEALKADPAIQNMVKQGVFQQLATLQQQAMQGVDAAPPGTGGPAMPPPPDQQQGMAPPSQEQLAAMQAMGPGQNGAVPPGAGMTIQQPPIVPPGAPGIPGTVSGAPGGVRNQPQGSFPLPGT